MIGIPYAYANDDGSVVCPICLERCAGVDESQRTAEDAITKGASAVYAEHYAAMHTHRFMSNGVIVNGERGHKCTICGGQPADAQHRTVAK